MSHLNARAESTTRLLDETIDILQYLRSHLAVIANLDEPDVRLEQALQSLDGNLSQSKVSLEQDLCKIQAHASRILGPRCFIDRLPVELMQDIFHMVLGTNEKTWFKDSIKLSHISRHWRMITASTPTMWSNFDFSIEKSKDDALCHFWTFLKERVRETPISIRIRGIYDQTAPRLALCNLSALEAIDELAFCIEDRSSSKDILNVDYSNLACKCRSLSVEATRGGDGSLADILHLFDEVEELTVSGMSSFTVGDSPKVSQLTKLALKDLSRVHILDILAATTQLRVLRFFDSTPTVTTPKSPLESQLEALYAAGVGDCEWIQHLRCPNLETIDLEPRPTEPIFRFIESCTGLKRVDCDVREISELLELIKRAPNIEHVALYDEIAPLYDWTTHHLLHPPFPHLHSLEIWDLTLTTETLGDLIKKRCLPQGHPLSEMDKGVQPIDTLKFCWRDNNKSVDALDLEGNLLLQDASQERSSIRRFNRTYTELTIKWNH
ncbi:SubName: Full=Uncharacterized protein {ECO:0000313/EMBL:CCA73454.1} [Serendipita indica DSM 11827]|nr:SubName: Full=Uncharacterized protein {ECO:0000313/EMBL:CCA73454.1} [Serendipita indica DSM 11827]